MIRSLLFCFFFGLLTTCVSAQSFSEDTRLSLLTCSAGTELYAKFGHSAIRVQDSLNGQDIVFNYGIFDFDTPNFYGKFIRGKLLYRLAVHDTRDFLEIYRQENRKVIEQEIQLTPVQRQDILAFLVANYRPENRYYLYDFFFDNCSTRIRDLLYSGLGDALSLPDGEAPEYTFRQMLDLELRAYPWPKFGMDLLLGTPADRLAGFSDEMFLPDFLSDNLAKVQVLQPDTVFQLMAPAVLLIAAETPKIPEEPPIWSPTLVSSLFFVGVVFFTVFAGPRFQRIFDRIFFILFGLLGSFLLFMWFGTDHAATKYNWNLLWLHPLYLIFPRVLRLKWGRWLLLLQVVLVLVLVVTWGHFAQTFNLALIPLWAAIGVRCGHSLLWRMGIGTAIRRR